MVIEQFVELLHGRVVDEVALRHRWRVPRRGLELVLHVLRRPIVLVRRAQPPGQVVASRLLLSHAKVMGQHLLLVLRLRIGDEPVQAMLNNDPAATRSALTPKEVAGLRLFISKAQ
jgi:hypothetical protein